MNQKNWLSAIVVFNLIIALDVLSGCTVYVQPPQPVAPFTPPPVEQPAPIYAAPAPPPVYDSAPVVQPEGIVSIHVESDFYEPLQTYGNWIDVPGYGHCWEPAGVDPDWRPYTDGHWQRTDAGWYWVSDEHWGWATYHYGRWHHDDNFGWVWLPQTQWAPAWVAWREGGGYTGWAPLPPEARIGDNGTFQSDNVDPHSFVFVEQARMLEPQHHQNVIVNNTTIINRSINITKVVVVNKIIINEGPRPEAVAQATGRPVEVMSARNLRTHQETQAVAANHSHLPVTSHTVAPGVQPPTQYHPMTAPNQAPIVRPYPVLAPVQIRPPVAAPPPYQPGKPQTQSVHAVIKPDQGALTAQQKLELEKKKKEAKQHLEKEKPHSGSSTNAPPPH